MEGRDPVAIKLGFPYLSQQELSLATASRAAMKPSKKMSMQGGNYAYLQSQSAKRKQQTISPSIDLCKRRRRSRGTDGIVVKQ